jgi:hypothetical protein
MREALQISRLHPRNAIDETPDPPRLGRRILALFRPHRRALTSIAAINLITSVLSQGFS